MVEQSRHRQPGLVGNQAARYRQPGRVSLDYVERVYPGRYSNRATGDQFTTLMIIIAIVHGFSEVPGRTSLWRYVVATRSRGVQGSCREFVRRLTQYIHGLCHYSRGPLRSHCRAGGLGCEDGLEYKRPFHNLKMGFYLFEFHNFKMGFYVFYSNTTYIKKGSCVFCPLTLLSGDVVRARVLNYAPGPLFLSYGPMSGPGLLRSRRRKQRISLITMPLTI